MISEQGPSQLLVPISSMAHHAHGPSNLVDHPYEIIVQLEDRRHPYGIKSATLLSYLAWPVHGFFPSGFALGLARLSRPANFLLPFMSEDASGAGAVRKKRDRRLAVVLLRSRIVLLVSRQVGGLSQHVDDCRRDNYGDHDESGNGCGIVSHASTSAFSSAL